MLYNNNKTLSLKFFLVHIIQSTLRMVIVILDFGIPFLFVLFMVFPDKENYGIHETVSLLS